MSQHNRSYRQTAYDKRNGTRRNGSGSENRSEYVYGNVVRQLEPQEEWERTPAKKQNQDVRKNRDRARHMNAGYVLFLAGALCASAYILVNYIQLHSDLVSLTKTVASKESELNNLKQSNDEEYNRILNSIDLEEIKRIAMGELGMIYAQEGQIVTYENEDRDYMRRVGDNNQ